MLQIVRLTSNRILTAVLTLVSIVQYSLSRPRSDDDHEDLPPPYEIVYEALASSSDDDEEDFLPPYQLLYEGSALPSYEAAAGTSVQVDESSVEGGGNVESEAAEVI